MPDLDRRSFVRRAAGAAGTALIPASLTGLVAACSEGGATGPHATLRGAPVGRGGVGAGGYGPLTNAQGALVLPSGFRLDAFGSVGDPMSDGNLTPIAHDGMAAFRAGGRRVRLVRNHEDRNGPVGVTLCADRPYDPAAGGGTTTLEVFVEGARRHRRAGGVRLLRSFVSLNGTAVNCAGGPTKWGSWLSCEETVVGTREGFTKSHGWVFEVPADADGPVPPVPIAAMGRFSHEAVAMDPRSGIVYETEDNAFPPGSGLYRYLPDNPRHLARGGMLQMAAVVGAPRLALFEGSLVGIAVGDAFRVEWVDIPVVDPDPNDELPEADRRAAIFQQGFDRGGAVFNRLEGCWFGGGSLVFHDTVGGAAGEGHVWRYIPDDDRDGGGTLVLVFESPGAAVLDNPDNITVSPGGGLVLCEDGSGEQFVRGLTREGRIFDFAKNELNAAEFAGATFSPDGRVLFVNIQGPTRGSVADGTGQGVTLAVTGPWDRGAF